MYLHKRQNVTQTLGGTLALQNFSYSFEYGGLTNDDEALLLAGVSHSRAT